MTIPRSLFEQLRQIIPPLNGTLHKGQSGRVGVLGGAKDYTGAPFFAAISALRMGADLSHVICSPTAAGAIKSYSPDLIVHPILAEGDSTSSGSVKQELSSLLERLHVLVLGPGLGRENYMIGYAKVALNIAKDLGMFVVIDADAIWMVCQDLDLIRGYRRAVVTPNVVEFKRLSEATGIDPSTAPESRASLVSKALGGVTVLQKGPEDIIASNTTGSSTSEAHEVSKILGSDFIAEEMLTKIDIEGGLKRCGGQGDVLSGCVGTWLAWAKCYETGAFGDHTIPSSQIPHLASVGGSLVTRTASRFAFQRMGRGLITEDMLGQIGSAFEDAFGQGEKGWGGKL